MNSGILDMLRHGHAVDDSIGGDGIDVDLLRVDDELADHDRMVLGWPHGFGCVLVNYRKWHEWLNLLKRLHSHSTPPAKKLAIENVHWYKASVNTTTDVRVALHSGSIRTSNPATLLFILSFSKDLFISEIYFLNDGLRSLKKIYN